MPIITLTKQLTMEELKRYSYLMVHEELKNNENKKVDMNYFYNIIPNTNVASYSIRRVFYDKKNDDKGKSETVCEGNISFTDLLKKVNEKIRCLKTDDMGVILSSIYVTGRLADEVYRGHHTRAPTRKIYRKPSTSKPAVRKPAARKPTRK